MASAQRKTRLVGVRELRQNLSVHLDRVKAGENAAGNGIRTRRRHPGTTAGGKLSPLERMVREGRAMPPKGSLKDRRPPQPAQPAIRPSKSSWLRIARYRF
jgi:hypothetical protein